jgi:hypothetical protein
VQGLVPSIQQVSPMSEHRTCVRHLYANFRNEGHKGILLKDLLWTAASSYTQVEFHRAMEEMKRVNKPAYEYLAKVDPSSWCRGWFNTDAKCDLLHNNTCESFNSWIKKFRDLTILSMLEGIRNKLMRRYVRKRELIRAMDGNIGPKIQAKLEFEEDESSHCSCTYAGSGLFEVESRGMRFVVNVEDKTCGCRKWDVSGIPCSHAISAILYHGGNPVDYISEYFGKEKYLESYDPIIYPVPSQEQWPRSDQPNIEPPKARVAAGRPKKLRQRGVEEPKNQYTMRRGGGKIQCGQCKKWGHNKRSCPARKRQDERREQQAAYYRSTAGIDWNLDMVS